MNPNNTDAAAVRGGPRASGRQTRPIVAESLHPSLFGEGGAVGPAEVCLNAVGRRPSAKAGLRRGAPCIQRAYTQAGGIEPREPDPPPSQVQFYTAGTSPE
jgi:hypothetical protein